MKDKDIKLPGIWWKGMVGIMLLWVMVLMGRAFMQAPVSSLEPPQIQIDVAAVKMKLKESGLPLKEARYYKVLEE